MHYFRTGHRRGIAVILGGLLLLAVSYQVKGTEVWGLFGGVIAGGGGTSTGSPYEIKGTLGQPLSNPSQGGQFGVQAGFWPGAGLLPTPGLTTTPTALPGAIAQGQAAKVDNAIAVWEDNRVGVWNIFGQNLDTLAPITITLNTADQRHPAISGNLVVWQGRQTGNWDIYGARLQGTTVGPIFPIDPGPGDQINPTVSNNVVIWQNETLPTSRSDIVGQDLTSGQVFTLTTAVTPTLNLNPAADFAVILNTPPNPNILTGTVVWQSTPPMLPGLGTLGAIMGSRGITTTLPSVFTITNGLIDHTNPAISGNNVVWQESLGTTWRIAGANIVTPTTYFTVTNGVGDSQMNPAIYGTTVLYQDTHTTPVLDPTNHHRWTILGATLGDPLPWRVSTNPLDATNPAISRTYGVWQQSASGSAFQQAVATTPVTGVYGTNCRTTFSDVALADYFYMPVLYLACNAVVGGYMDGTFRPYNLTTRGQLAKIIVNGESWPLITPATPTFQDVPPDSPFYSYIETAAAHGIINGYADGTFRPGNNVTRGQLSKIIVLAEGWPVVTPPTPTFTDVPTSNIFYSFVETAVVHSIVSGYNDGTFRPNNPATRGQIAKIVYLAVTEP